MSKKSQRRYLENLTFEISGACNLLCRHCYFFKSGEQRARPDRLSVQIIDDLIRKSLPLGLKQCTFTGGEILLRKDIFDILERCKLHGMDIFLLSNLTLLNDKDIAALHKLPIAMVATSLDGIDATHDAFRGKKGAFKSTLEAAKKLRAAGISVKVSITVTPDNYREIPALLAYLEAENIITAVTRIAPLGRGKNHKDEHDFDKLYARIFAKHLYKVLPSQALLNMKPAPEVTNSYCGIGQNMLYILSDGRVSYCPTLITDDDSRWLLGNVLKTDIVEIWKRASDHTGFQCEDISTCQFGNLCRGGCRANALARTGSLFACDTEMLENFNELKKLQSQLADPEYKVV